MALLGALSPRVDAASSKGEAVVAQVLQSVRQHLGMEVAYVSEFVGDESVFRNVDAPGLEALIKPGDSRPLDDVYCRHIIAGRLPELIPDTSQIPFAAEMPITKAVPIGAHVSVPLRMGDGSVYGMFCCLSPHANASLNERDLQVLRAFADIAAQQINKDRESTRQQRAIRAHIEHVIEAGAFHIVFQPIWNFQTGRPAGFESLSRFTAEPLRSPDKWFAEAAEAGLGIELELATIGAALRASEILPPDMYVAVNASAEAITSGLFAEVLAGFPLQRLVIELTEHRIIENYTAVTAAVEELRARGAKLAIDDAGAGYAGLQHIVQLNPDIIKLDMALTRNVDSDPARRALAAALIFYSNETGCSILAEGIETEQELMTLKLLGINKGQGYYLGRPMTVDAVKEMFSAEPVRAAG